jgi:hypothetical protein
MLTVNYVNKPECYIICLLSVLLITCFNRNLLCHIGNLNNFVHVCRRVHSALKRQKTWRSWEDIRISFIVSVDCEMVNGILHIDLPTLTFWHRSFTFNSNKSPTWCNSFSVYYPDVSLQLNMFWAFSRPSSGAPWLQWQPLVGPAGRPDHEHSTTVTTIWR